MTVNKITNAPTQNEVIEKINEIIDDSVSDVQINGTSIVSNDVANIVTNTAYNASSNKLATMSDVPDDYLTNTATGTGSLAIGGTASDRVGATSVGYTSVVSANNTTALGYNSQATSQYSITIGRNSKTSGASAIQIGYGTNSTANTLSVGFYNNSSTHYNWQLLDGTTGLIPDDRISSNIARTSAIANMQTTSNLVTSMSDQSTDTQYPSAKCVYDAIDAAGGVVDGALSITSANAIMNKAVTEAIADLSSNVNLEAYLDMIIAGTYADLPYTIQSSYNDDLDDVIDGTYTGV